MSTKGERADADLSDSRPAPSALEERANAPSRVPRVQYAEGRVLRRVSDRRLESWLLAPTTPKFGDYGFGSRSSVFVDRAPAWMQEEEAINSSSRNSDEDARVSAVKRKQRTELNPTMVKAFKTSEARCCRMDAVDCEGTNYAWTEELICDRAG